MLGRIRIEDYTVEHINRVLALNCTQVALFMREVVPVMRRQKSGNVINVTSIAARHGGGGGAILYAGAKGFVSTVTHGWAKEVVGDGIRVNAVSPGVITTPFHDRYSNAEQLKAMQATIPMNRLGSADECAGTFLYLASDALSGYVTGQVIEVNGGQLHARRGRVRFGSREGTQCLSTDAAGSPPSRGRREFCERCHSFRQSEIRGGQSGSSASEARTCSAADRGDRAVPRYG